ncbi:hypothetical protein AVEN_117517-1 [Araneus ventricosus]|uniref:Uncharacterized protein n=1 Tax=Araneus ventricosus TaxID=182803 RepID=A0A4Y2P5V0_ARAVE|nr:hypothetical protein AVEN_117517-1 [Araneus ventricosus]
MSATVRAIIVIISDLLSVLLLICASAVFPVTRASCFLEYSRIMRHYPACWTAFAVHPPYDFCDNILEDSCSISDNRHYRQQQKCERQGLQPIRSESHTILFLYDSRRSRTRISPVM